MSPHGTGSTTIYVCARALYVRTNRLIIEAMYIHVCMSISVHATLEIWLPSNCRCMVLCLEIKRHHGEIEKMWYAV